MTDDRPANPISAGSTRRLAIALTHAFGNDRDKRLAWVSERVGRSVGSTSELTEAEYDAMVAEAEALPRVEHDDSPKPRKVSDPQPEAQTVPLEMHERLARTLDETREDRDKALSALAEARAHAAQEQTDLAPQVHVTEAIRRVMVDIGHVGVGKEGRFESGNTRYSFRGIDQFVDALSPILARHGVIVAPQATEPRITEHPTSRGGTQFMVVTLVKWHIYGPAGDFITAATIGQAMDSSDKAANKAMSAAYKYVLGQVFTIPNIGWAEQDAERPEVASDEEQAAHQAERDAQEAAVRGERAALWARLVECSRLAGVPIDEFTQKWRDKSAGGRDVETVRTSAPPSLMRAYVEAVEKYQRDHPETIQQPQG